MSRAAFGPVCLFGGMLLAQNLRYWTFSNLGFVYHLKCIPPSGVMNNNRSALREADFVSQEIAKLCVIDDVEKVERVPYFMSPLSVLVQASGRSGSFMIYRF